MSGFKLIAIRPLKGCSQKFLKVLKAGEVYQFYNDYHFKFVDNDKEKDVESIEYKSTVPDGLYDVGDLKVNISAVVGKNGSGKSSLMKLLYKCLYKIGIDSDVIDNLDIYKAILKEKEERIQREISWAKQREPELIRKELEARKKQELDDVKNLFNESTTWHKSTILNNFIKEVEKRAIETNTLTEELQNWLT